MALRFHHSKRGLAQMKSAVQVHAEHAPPVGLRQLIEGYAVEDASVAHHRIEAAEPVDCRTNDRLSPLGARHRFVRRHRVTAAALDLFDDPIGDAGIRSRAVHRASEVVHHYRPPAPRNLHRIEPAETSASSSDDHHLPCKVDHVTPRTKYWFHKLPSVLRGGKPAVRLRPRRGQAPLSTSSANAYVWPFRRETLPS